MVKIEENIPKRSNQIFLMFNWKLRKAYERDFKAIGEKLKLTGNEIDVLLFLRNNHHLDTAKDIVKYRSMSKAMISKSVDSLHKRGFLEYETDKMDKRCIHLKITPSASSIVEGLAGVQKRFFDKLTKNITKKEQEAIERVLRKMYENIIKEK